MVSLYEIWFSFCENSLNIDNLVQNNPSIGMLWHLSKSNSCCKKELQRTGTIVCTPNPLYITAHIEFGYEIYHGFSSSSLYLISFLVANQFYKEVMV